jgi:hypothetical protein
MTDDGSRLPSEVEAFFGKAGLLYYFRALEEGGGLQFLEYIGM